MYSTLLKNYARALDSRLQFRPTTKGLSVYRDGIYCGPGWGFTLQDVETGRIREMPHAFDAIDQVCQLHDQCFFDHGFFAIKCDRTMLQQLATIIFAANSNAGQRVDAVLMASYFALQAMVVDVPWFAYRDIRERMEAMFRSGASMIEVIQMELSRNARTNVR